MRYMPDKPQPRIVIVGAGFGGLAAAQALADAPAEVVVVDRHNYHLFQPLLYQVATAGLSPADIAAPIRSVLAPQANTSVILARVAGVDAARNELVTTDGRRIEYDYLVLATGARHAYFGRDEWEQHAPGIKKIDDAIHLRRKILLAFERAENEPDPDERRALLTFAIVGGGPTGVEMAGAIAELARKALARDFRNIDPRETRVILIEAGPRLLPAFDPDLSEVARRSLEALGVEVRLGARVMDCSERGVSFGPGDAIESRCIVWGAGVRASQAAKWIGAETDNVGRAKVGPDLTVPGHPNVFVIGDTAHALDMDGKPLPGVAPVAKQQGRYVAQAIKARLRGASVPRFMYRNWGSLATIGRRSAVVQFGATPDRRRKLSGYLAWWLWGIAHIAFLIGFRNRVSVVTNWVWSYLTFARGTRLITGPDPDQPVEPARVGIVPGSVAPAERERAAAA
ncbi:MAG: NAD(P)/FAD-dependent oxidoreductase [Methylobacteriaceae bacterium]|nr:NAD(P)/FAD-dependent oxidoreductase [Methylobacteriaceae bacterium]